MNNTPGLFTGSGMPMRFADLGGTMIDVYQATTQMTDESGQSYPDTIDTLLDRATGAQGYFGAFVANIHTDGSTESQAAAIVASAQARGVPVVSAKQMLTWLDGRNGSTFANFGWGSGVLTFDVVAGTGSQGLRGMLPAVWSAGSLASLTRGGGAVTWTTETIKGISYAVFDAGSGSYVASYTGPLPDLTPPTISGLTANPGSAGTATVAWTTDEPATSVVEYGTDSGLANAATASSATLTTTHSLSLGGLLPNATYYYRATSADASGNASTSPIQSFLASSSGTLVDTTQADFGGGTPDANLAITTEEDGEVRLLAAQGSSEFEGAALPVDWTSVEWVGGGTATVGSGQLVVSGARAATQPTLAYLPGTVLEFQATFGADQFQSAGFGAGDDTTGGSGMFTLSPYAVFGTDSTTTKLFARVATTGLPVDTDLDPAGTLGLIGTPHTYKIQWTSTSIVFSVDGLVRHTETVAIATAMRIGASEAAATGTLAVDWMRVTHYATPGTFVSRVFDGRAPQSTWGVMTWTADRPAETGLAMSVRTGDTSPPAGDWVPVASSGAALGATGQYLQYQAVLSSTDGQNTPVLRRVEIGYNTKPDNEAPTILVRTPASWNDGRIAAGRRWWSSSPRRWTRRRSRGRRSGFGRWGRRTFRRRLPVSGDTATLTPSWPSWATWHELHGDGGGDGQRRRWPATALGRRHVDASRRWSRTSRRR